MLHKDLINIFELNGKIEKALEDSNFIELAPLSSKLETIVKLITDNSDYRKNIRQEEVDTLKNLLIKVKKYQVETEMKFKNYTLRISKQTKMKNAYKHSSS